LLRGRQGTEDIANGGKILQGSIFILLEAAQIALISNTLADINRPILYRAITAGQTIASGVEIIHTDTGRDLRPYCPVFLDAVANVGGGLDTSWIRRTRFNGEWSNFTGEVPLNEGAESFTATLRTPGFADLINNSENHTFFYVDANTTANDQGDLSLAATIGSEAAIQGAQVAAGAGAIEFTPSGINSFDSIVTYPTTTNLQITNQEFTIEVDVRFKDLTETVQTLVAKARDSGGGNAWAFEYEGGGLSFRAYDGTTTIIVDVSSAWTPVINTWYKVAVTRDNNSDYRLYVDGTQIGTTQNDTATLVVANSLLSLGSREDGIGADNEPLYGFLDNVLIVLGEALYTGTSYNVIQATLGVTLASKTVIDATTASFTEAELEGDATSTDGTPQLIDDFGTDPDGGGGWTALSGTTLSSVASSGNISAPPGASGNANFALQAAAGNDGVRYGMTKIFDPITDGPFTSTTQYNGTNSAHIEVWIAADVVTEQTVELLVDVLDMDGNSLGITYSNGQITLAANGTWEQEVVHVPLVPEARSIRIELAHTGNGTGATAVGFDVLEVSTHTPPSGIILEVVQNSSVPAVTGIPAIKTVT
jgi:hypothetical protein